MPTQTAVLSVPEKIMIPAIAADGSHYPIEKLEAHRDAIFHLAVSVFVFDKTSGALLIQRRAHDKYHCGGMWANTCCTHPHWDEALGSSASRRLQEELGFSLPLAERRVFEYSADCGNGLHEHEQVTFYVGYADQKTLMLDPNPDEVSETKWATVDELQSLLVSTPDVIAPWFRIYLTKFPQLDF